MTCRGTIEVKGKGSMVTYFLKGKGETPMPTPQSPITATITDIPVHLTNGSGFESPSDALDEHSDLVPLSGSFGDQTTEEMDDEENIDYSKLTQKRKSLCRQPNISHPPPTSTGESSLSQSSDASDSQASQALLERTTNAENMANTIAHSTNLVESIILGRTNQSNTFEALPRNQVNELKHHSMPPLSNKSHLMDSIESLEKFLKNDLSLAEFNSRNSIKAQVLAQSHTAQIPLRPAKQQPQQPRINRINELLSKSNDALNKGIGTTLKESIKVNRRTVMKLSQSLYPIAHHRVVVSKCKIPNSKSCDLLL